MNLVFSIICLFNITSAHSTDKLDFEAGDTLYVWVNDGLLIRTAPSFDSPTTGKLTYGEQVIVTGKDEGKHEFIIVNSTEGNKTIFPKIFLTGSFVEISHKGNHGFIFDGFLYPGLSR